MRGSRWKAIEVLADYRGSTSDEVISMAFRSRSRARGWFFRTKQPHHVTFLIALVLAILGVASTRLHIDYVSTHAFWFVLAAYIVLALGTLIDGL